MHHLIVSILPHVQSLVASGGPAIVFLVTLLEGIPPLGLFVPAHTIVNIGAFLARLGVTNLAWVSVAAFAGMTLGDFAGFAMGRRYGYGFLARAGRLFALPEGGLERLKGLIGNNLGKALVLGKVNPLSRVLAPFAVGASEAGFARFAAFDIAANLIWTAIEVAIGYAFGASYEAAAGYLGKALVIFILGAILIVLSYRFVNRQFHIFARYELFALLANLLGMYGLFKMVEDASSPNSFMLNLDISVHGWVALHMAPAVHAFMTVVTDVCSPAVIFALALVAMAYLGRKGEWKKFFVVASSTVGAYSLAYLLKEVFVRIRPADSGLALGDYSFPSGHATAAGLALVLAVYLFAPKMRALYRRELFICAAFVVFLVAGASRVYLAQHWLSDVIAGWSLGIFWATGMILTVKYAEILWRAWRSWRDPDFRKDI